MPGLPPELDGLRIAHLSDFHLGVPSRGRRAVERAVRWVAERRPDLVCITGDLLSRPRGEASSTGCSRGSPAPVRRARQPRLRDLARPVLAARRARRPRRTGRCSPTVGRRRACAARRSSSRASTRAPGSPSARVGFPDSEADLRILLCHFPARSTASSRALPPRSSPAICTAARSCCRTASAGCCSPIRRAVRAGRLPPRPTAHARLARARDDLRAVPVLRPPRGDRARSTIRVMEGHSVISPDVLARYAADAAAEVPACAISRRSSGAA